MEYRFDKNLYASYCTYCTCPSNFGAADLLYTPDMIFQVTVSEVHPIKQVELVKIVENMPAYKKNNPISLVFVVPDDIYDNFKYQDIVTKDKTSKTFRKVIKLDSKLKNMQQWVLKVDINTDKSPMFAKTGVTLGSDFKSGSSSRSSTKVESNLLGAAKTKSKSRSGNVPLPKTA